MATRINTCSSSSLKHDIHIPTRRFTSLSSRTSHTSKWISQISSRTHAKRNLVLKSSNGNPLKAVPLQDGEFLIPQFALLLFFLSSLGEMGCWCFSSLCFFIFCLPVFYFSWCLKKMFHTSQCSQPLYLLNWFYDCSFAEFVDWYIGTQYLEERGRTLPSLSR